MPPASPANIILDTDLGSDCDDAGALAVLHALANRGEANILACIFSSEKNPFGPGCLDAINHYYGRGDIPIGASQGAEVGDPRNDFLEPIATNHARYRHKVTTASDVPDLVAVYRQALASADDHSVRIVSIGHLKGLHSLLSSTACGASPLPGRALIEKKVVEWVAMAGEFPVEAKPGWNLSALGAARYSSSVIAHWPTPIVFSGYEIGLPLVTGPSLSATPEQNPVREAYRLWDNALHNGRASWDQTAVLYAVRGLRDYWETQKGVCRVDAAGRTSWINAVAGNHSYLVARAATAAMTTLIGGLMAEPPLV